ncbi:MAG: malate dehydrogenase [Dehalococcoidales bacterium]|nr:MAG: malate dehydrogenase [Dehalococcoidales bacterium]
MNDRFKVSIIGDGNVGSACAQRIVERDYADVVLLDIIEGLPQGKALDIQQSASVVGFNSRIIGTNDYEETAGSDVVVITSGSPRKPGMTRDDLLLTNMKIVSEVTSRVVAKSPDCVIIVATNPVDAMVQLARHVSQFPQKRVLGLSGVLDAARLSTFVAAESKMPVEYVDACVLGEHGKNMVVIPRLTKIQGRPITELLPAESISKLVERTIGGGAEIVGLLKTGSAFYAPSAAITQMVDAILLNKDMTLSCAMSLNGEYGLTDTVISVPVKLGQGGVEEVVELELTSEERQALANSAKAVQELIGVMKLD